MRAPCTHPGCFQMAVHSSEGTCAEHFLRESYARLNQYAKVLTRGEVDAFSMNEMKVGLYAIAEKACVIAQTGVLAKIHQIRLLELEELVGKTLCSMRALSSNQQFPLFRFHFNENARPLHLLTENVCTAPDL